MRFLGNKIFYQPTFCTLLSYGICVSLTSCGLARKSFSSSESSIPENFRTQSFRGSVEANSLTYGDIASISPDLKNAMKDFSGDASITLGLLEFQSSQKQISEVLEDKNEGMPDLTRVEFGLTAEGTERFYLQSRSAFSPLISSPLDLLVRSTNTDLKNSPLLYHMASEKISLQTLTGFKLLQKKSGFLKLNRLSAAPLRLAEISTSRTASEFFQSQGVLNPGEETSSLSDLKKQFYVKNYYVRLLSPGTVEVGQDIRLPFQIAFQCAHLDLYPESSTSPLVSISWPRISIFEKSTSDTALISTTTKRTKISNTLTALSSQAMLLVEPTETLRSTVEKKGNRLKISTEKTLHDETSSRSTFLYFREATNYFFSRFQSSVQTPLRVSQTYASFQHGVNKLTLASERARTEFGDFFPLPVDRKLKIGQEDNDISTKWFTGPILRALNSSNGSQRLSESVDFSPSGIHYFDAAQLDFLYLPLPTDTTKETDVVYSELDKKIETYCKTAF